MSSGRAELHDSHNSSSSSTPNTRQSHTIKWAVARYVSSPVVNSIDHVLIDKHVGTTPTEYQAKPQCSMDADDQAEQCPPQTETNSEEDQADQQYPPQRIQDPPLVHRDRAEPCLTGQGAAISRDHAEHHDITSSSSSSTQNIRQPFTNLKQCWTHHHQMPS